MFFTLAPWQAEADFTQPPPIARRWLLTLSGDFLPTVSDGAIHAIPTAVRVISHIVGFERLLDIGPLPPFIAGVAGGPIPVFVSRLHGFVRNPGIGESAFVIATKIIPGVTRQVFDLDLGTADFVANLLCAL